MQKTQNKSGHSPSTRENILIFHQNPLQHPISALSASHVIIYCVYDIREQFINNLPVWKENSSGLDSFSMNERIDKKKSITFIDEKCCNQYI